MSRGAADKPQNAQVSTLTGIPASVLAEAKSKVAATATVKPTPAAPAEHLEKPTVHQALLQLIASYRNERLASDAITSADKPTDQPAKLAMDESIKRLHLRRGALTQALADSIAATGKDAEDARIAAANFRLELDNVAQRNEAKADTLFTALHKAATDKSQSIAGITFGTPEQAEAAKLQKALAEEANQKSFLELAREAAGPGGNRVDALMAWFDRATTANEPKQIVQRDQLIEAGHKFVERAQKKGLLHLSSQELQDAGAALGVIQANIAGRHSFRQMVNVVISGATYAIPATVKAAIDGVGKIDLVSRDKDGNLQFSGMDKFTESLKQAGVDFGGDIKNVFKDTATAVGVSERVRMTQEMWHAMLGSRGNSMLMEEPLTTEDLKALPPSLINKVVAQEKARQGKADFKPEDITLYHLALSLPQEVRTLATMNTGALAKAAAQNGQEAYAMSFHDVSMWGVLGGQPAAHMMQYVRQDVGQEPPTRYSYHSSGRQGGGSGIWGVIGMNPSHGHANNRDIYPTPPPFERAKMRDDYDRTPG